MTNIQKYALDTTKEIVVAKMASSAISVDQAGEPVANFFEAVYNKIYEIASKDEKI